jgi:hypothetical protein
MTAMLTPMPSALLARWGGVGLVAMLVGFPLFASCTSSEDTEPFIPATQGAKQPSGSGDLVSEAEACDRVRQAAADAYDRLRCPAPAFADCPEYVRPGGASGCYEYYETSVAACEQAYEGARSCSTLAPCIVSAELNDQLETCEQLDEGAGGQGGGSALGGAGAGTDDRGGAGPSEAGAPATGGAGGTNPALAGAGGS